jgi:hypothetical protein
MQQPAGGGEPVDSADITAKAAETTGRACFTQHGRKLAHSTDPALESIEFPAQTAT